MANADWFDVLATLFYIFSFIVSALISSFSYKVYKLTKEKKFRNFSIAFLFITLSFVVQAATNLIIYFNLQKGSDFILAAINNGFTGYALLTIAGFFLLALLSLKITDIKVISLVAVLIIVALFVSPAFIVAFHLILLALLAFLTFNFYKNCCEKKSLNSKTVFMAFLFMTFAHIFHLAGRYTAPVFIAGNIIQFIGYLALLIAILRVK